MASDRLLIFCKAPVSGHVKTRLSPALSADQAAALYAASLRDVVTLSARERAVVELWCEGEQSVPYFRSAYPHLKLQVQSSGTLGDRQRDAFARSFASGAQRVIIIGSDSPTLPEAYLQAAIDDLHEAAGVIGPAHDGGYYLIGLRAPAWPAAFTLFDQMEWSTPHVFADLMRRADRLGIELRVLPGWYDFDVPDDLALLRADAAAASHVGQWLRGQE